MMARTNAHRLPQPRIQDLCDGVYLTRSWSTGDRDKNSGLRMWIYTLNQEDPHSRKNGTLIQATEPEPVIEAVIRFLETGSIEED